MMDTYLFEEYPAMVTSTQWQASLSTNNLKHKYRLQQYQPDCSHGQMVSMTVSALASKSLKNG